MGCMICFMQRYKGATGALFSTGVDARCECREWQSTVLYSDKWEAIIWEPTCQSCSVVPGICWLHGNQQVTNGSKYGLKCLSW